MTSTTAQVSLYPLRQASLSPAIDEAVQILQSYDLDIEPGTMSTLVAGDDVVIFAALQDTFHHLSELGDTVMVATFSNACPIPARREKSITYTAIGHVENEFDEPTAPDKIRSAESRIALEPTLTEGLKGLETGQKVLVLFDFHLARGFNLLQHPRGDESRPRRGVFALRSANRPNAIGVSEVDLLAIEGNVLRVRGLDAIHGTPVIDLKPA